jgi:hypothetical protein
MDASVGRTGWEWWQAEIRTPRRISSQRAPAEIHLDQLKYFVWQLSGGALGVNDVKRPKVRLPPFPACSTH